MFRSFFPKPKLFFTSLVLWALFCIFVWYSYSNEIGKLFGLTVNQEQPVIGLGHFVTDSFILLYLYYTAAVCIFGLFWTKTCPHRWQRWSIFGSAAILFSTYFSVQVSVAINNWRRPFFDMVQNALTAGSSVQASDLYSLISIFSQIAFLFIIIFVGTRFLVSHYIFRWRTAMNDYYTEQWPRVRHIEVPPSVSRRIP